MVVGLGTFGTMVASELCRYGNPVLVIDIDEKRVSPFAETAREAIIADGREEAALREAGVGDYDVAVVGIGEDLEANILCTMNVKMLGVKTIWAKASNRTHHRILAKLDIDRIILPEQETGRHVAQMLNFPLMRDFINMGNGFSLINLMVPDVLTGKTVSELPMHVDENLRVLGAMRGTAHIDCTDGTARLEKGDRLFVLGRRAGLEKFIGSLPGGR